MADREELDHYLGHPGFDQTPEPIPVIARCFCGRELRQAGGTSYCVVHGEPPSSMYEKGADGGDE